MLRKPWCLFGLRLASLLFALWYAKSIESLRERRIEGLERYARLAKPAGRATTPLTPYRHSGAGKAPDQRRTRGAAGGRLRRRVAGFMP